MVPPGQHQRNSVERGIQTFKEHLLGALATCDPTFPVREWDRLLPQVEITLNLLRTSRINSNLSAYAYLFGTFNFNKTPLAPPGTKAMVHVKPDKRKSWDYHAIDGFYIGPALEHYRCLKTYIPKTHRERVADTVKIIPNVIPFPQSNLDDHIKNVSEQLFHLLKNKNTPTGPFLPSSTKNSLI